MQATAAPPTNSSPAGDTETVSAGDIRLDVEGYRAFVGDRAVTLSYQEFELLRMLASRRDRIISYDELVRGLWGDACAGTRRRLSVVICRLRAKLAGARPYNIETVRGRGYGLTASDGPGEARERGRGAG
jgi:DNA-binding response OmpR family regulator